MVSKKATEIDGFRDLLTERLSECSKSLNRNWTAQCILSITGLVSIHSRKLAEDLLETSHGIVSISVDSLELLIPTALFFLYIRFGYLLWYYFFTRSLEEQEWTRGIENGVELEKMRDVLVRQMVFDPVYTINYPQHKDRSHQIAFRIIIACLAATISLNHICTISMFIYSIGKNLWSALAIIAYLLILMSFYCQFCKKIGDLKPSALKQLTMITVIIVLAFLVLGAISGFVWIT